MKNISYWVSLLLIFLPIKLKSLDGSKSWILQSNYLLASEGKLRQDDALEKEGTSVSNTEDDEIAEC